MSKQHSTLSKGRKFNDTLVKVAISSLVERCFYIVAGVDGA